MHFGEELDVIRQLPLAQFVELTTEAIMEGSKTGSSMSADSEKLRLELRTHASRLSLVRGHLADQIVSDPAVCRDHLMRLLTRVREQPVLTDATCSSRRPFHR